MKHAPQRTVIVAALSVLLSLIAPHLLAPAHAEPPTPAVELRGDREWRFDFAAVYRRFDTLAVKLHQPPPLRDEQRLLATIQRQPAPDPDAPEQREPADSRVIAHTRLHRAPQAPDHRMRGELDLDHADPRPIPVGRYRLDIWREAPRRTSHEARYRHLASRSFFVIFNARDPADRGVHKTPANRWLTSQAYIVQLVNGELSNEPWDLDIHHPDVFQLAMSLVDGARTAEEAAQRLIPGVSTHVEGHWPRLPDTAGRIPPRTPDTDPDWAPSQVTSALERLRIDDKRGQCFDYAMLYVAFLRSVGIPARTITTVDPAPMPHPHAPTRKVEWDYHVWAELFVDGRWQASDVTYLDNAILARLPTHRYPGLQPPHAPWFASAMAGPTRLWTAAQSEMREIGQRYGILGIDQTHRLARALPPATPPPARP